MAKKKGFYEYVKAHFQRKGRGVKLTIYLPEGSSSNLFSEIKSSVRKKQTRKQTASNLTASRPTA